jgi:hypothetical protein
VSARVILEQLRPLFEERAGTWDRMRQRGETFVDPEEITLTASFPVQALREALAPPAPAAEIEQGEVRAHRVDLVVNEPTAKVLYVDLSGRAEVLAYSRDDEGAHLIYIEPAALGEAVAEPGQIATIRVSGLPGDGPEDRWLVEASPEKEALWIFAWRVGGAVQPWVTIWQDKPAGAGEGG